MKKIACFLAMVFFINTSFSQKKLQYNKWIAKFSPLSLADLGAPTFHLAAEYRFSFRWASQLDIGVPFKPVMLKSRKDSKQDFNFFKLRTELHYYFINTRENRTYVGLEVFYFPQKYTRYNGYAQKDFSTYRYSSSRISKTIWGSCIKIGKQPDINIFKNRGVMDMYCGLGFRQVSLIHRLGEAEKIENLPLMHFSRDVEEGTEIKPHVSLGFKIGYIL